MLLLGPGNIPALAPAAAAMLAQCDNVMMASL